MRLAKILILTILSGLLFTTAAILFLAAGSSFDIQRRRNGENYDAAASLAAKTSTIVSSTSNRMNDIFDSQLGVMGEFLQHELSSMACQLSKKPIVFITGSRSVMISWAIAKCNDLSPTHDRIIWRRMSDVETIQVSGKFMETRCIPAHGPTHIQKGNGEDAVCTVSRDNNRGESIHKASFYGLSPGRYEYSISTRWRDTLQAHTPWCDFEVHPEHPTMMPLDIAVIADVQSGARVFRQAIDILVKEKKKLPDTLIHLGDAVQSARIQRELHAYFWGPIEARGFGERVPLIFAQGNHDLGSDIMREHFPDPSWHVIYKGGLALLVLDSNDSGQPQLDFINRVLREDKFRSASFRIVLVHIAPFIEYWEPSTWARGEKNWGRFVREVWVPLFEEFGVDVVLSGHSHIYQRGMHNGIVHIICGGGGGELEDVDKNHVEDYGMYAKTMSVHHMLRLHFDPAANSLSISAMSLDSREKIFDRVVLQAHHDGKRMPLFSERVT